jgi:hypothetical protein
MVALDVRNSRMKDFHDVWALSDAFAFDGPTLRQAITACFARRGMSWASEVPRPLTPGFYRIPVLEARWRAYLARGAVVVLPPAPFEVIGERVISLIAPVRRSIVVDEPCPERWPAGGPWR